MTRWTVILLTLALPMAGCIGPLSLESSPDVMATHYPIAFLTSEIAGDALDVQAFVEGSQPHDFDPSFSDRQRFSEAGLVIQQGAGLDGWVHDMEASAGEDAPPILALSDTVELIDHAEADSHDDHEEGSGHEDHDEGDHEDGHGDHDGEHEAHGEGIDPHTWTDPVRMIDHARAIEAALVETWPDHAEGFQERSDALVDELETLHASYEQALATCETRTFVTSHDAFAYAADRYNLTVETVHGLSPETEPSASTIDRLSTIVEEHNITTVFFEEFVDADVIETIADETGADTDVLSPAAALTDDQRDQGETYLTRMQANLDALADAMRCSPSPEA